MNKSILCLIISQVIFFKAFAQWRNDGISMINPIDDPAATYYGGINAWPAASFDLRTFPLNVVVLDNGNTWNMNDIKTALYDKVDEANDAFSGANIRFVVYNKIKKKNNQSGDFQVTSLQNQATALPDYNEKAINVYIVNDAHFVFTPIGGYATYPWLKGYRDVVILKKNDLINQKFILAHELGHLFGLYHTFGKGVPLNQSNDDFIPDTDWDPNFAGTNQACAAPVHNFGKALNNIMAYNFGCNTKGFTLNQLQLMREIATTNVANKGRSDDFLAECENIDINFTEFADIPGNNTIKHIIKTNKNITINASLNMSKIIIEANKIIITDGTIGGANFVLAGNPCVAMKMASNEEDLISDFSFENQKQELDIQFSIIPNPVKNQFRIFLYDSIVPSSNLKIISIAGNIIHQEILNFHSQISNEIDISQLESGIYIVELSTENSKKVQRVKFLKE